MDKLTAIKIKYKDGTYSDQIPVSVLGKNVEWDNTHTLVDILGSVDVAVTGTIQDQISQLFNEKVSNSQMQSYVANQVPTYVTSWLNTNVNPVGSAVIVDNGLTIEGAAADAQKVGDEILNLKSGLNIKSNWTNHVISFNKNYLDSDDININGYFLQPKDGKMLAAKDYSCGYIRFPSSGTYKLYQSKQAFGDNQLYIPLYDANKKYYKSILGTAIDDYIIEFILNDADAKNATFIGVSGRLARDPMPMLILNGDYPSNKVYIKPMYDFPDLRTMRYMGRCPLNLNKVTISGWYQNVNAGPSSDWEGLPDNMNAIGTLIVLTDSLNDTYSFQFIIDSYQNPNIWSRYVAKDGSYQTRWSKIALSANIDALSAKINSVLNSIQKKISMKRISLSGNYFDYENAEWLDGFDNGTSIDETQGYHYAFAELQGPGTYIRVMRHHSFGTVAARVALYDKNKKRLKYITATRISDTDGFSFILSEEDALLAYYTTMNYKEGYEYYSALFYESDAYPLKAGYNAGLPNYKPISDALYKSIFICDGDSICQAVADQPKYASGWWGRIALDYSVAGKNYGIGGGTITSGLYYDSGSPRHWVNESIDTIHSEYPELDYLILEGGTNDADLIGRFSGETAPAKFGSWSETDFTGNYDNTTFCGAVDTMFYKAVTYWPKAKLGFIVAMQMGTNDASSANRRRYFDEIKAIAKKWHIPVLDLWDESQMDARLTIYYDPAMTSAENVAAGKCYYDGQHPTSYGYDLMQNKIDSWIHSL